MRAFGWDGGGRFPRHNALSRDAMSKRACSRMWSKIREEPSKYKRRWAHDSHWILFPFPFLYGIGQSPRVIFWNSPGCDVLAALVKVASA